MATRMQQRRGTSTDWTTANPVLAAGELGFESDSGYFKIGDGVNQWADLPYFESADVFTASLADYIELAEKGAANGVAELDANGNVPINQLGNIIDGAPGVLDTLNELAAALNDDADFFTTITTSISSGDSTTLASAQAYTDNALANFTTLPDQTGNSGEYLTTDGTTASWAPLTLDKAVGDLTDVTLTTPADGDALVYDANTATWVNGVVDVAGAIATANEYTDNAIAAIPPTDLTGYATESYVGTAISNLVDSAPATLDTLNELAAALGDDANFATTVTNSIAAKADATNPEFSVTASFTPSNGAYISIQDWGNDQVRIQQYSYTSLIPYAANETFFFTNSNYSGSNVDNIEYTVISNDDFGMYNQVIAIPTNSSDYTQSTAWATAVGGSQFSTATITFNQLANISSELASLSGVSGNIQSQLDSKVSTTIADQTYVPYTTYSPQLALKADKLVSFSTVSTSTTLSSTSYQDKLIQVSAAATITIPADTTTNFSVGTTISLLQTGTGTVTVVGAAGVTLNYTPSNTLRTQWSTATLIKRAANTWILSGDLL